MIKVGLEQGETCKGIVMNRNVLILKQKEVKYTRWETSLIMYQSNRSFNIPPWHLTPFLAREGGNLITTHRGWGVWSLASISCYKINYGRDSGDVKLWLIQRERLLICGGLVENQRSTQAVFCIWRCLRRLIFIVYKYVLSNKPCLHAQLQKHNRSYWKV